MKQEEIFSILENEEIGRYLNDMSRIHMYTKHYLLIAEELSESGVTFLQPLKEHRDAYDHLMRIFALADRDDYEKLDVEKYVLDNIRKAFGHEYRAFFDMADWFTYICRKYIREELSFKSKRKKYAAIYDYDEAQKLINEVPFEIAKFREEKDVSNKRLILGEVISYKETMDKLLQIYKQVKSL